MSVTYFCTCFACGSPDVCAHREPELVAWWISERSKQPVPAAETGLQARGGIADVPSPEPAPERTTGLPARKPFIRAEALNPSGFRATVSREDALAQRRG